MLLKNYIFLAVAIFSPNFVAGDKAVACERSALKLRCSNGVMIIQRAMYGREDDKECRPPGDSRAHLYDPSRCSTLVDMTAIVRYHCQFQPSCDFDVSQIPFDFECDNVIAYLRVSYNCLPLLGDVTTRRAPAATSRNLTTITPPATAATSTTTTRRRTTTTPMTTTTRRKTTTVIEDITPDEPSVDRPMAAFAGGEDAASNNAGEIAKAIINEAMVDSTDETSTRPLYPIMGTNDLLSGWGACPECDFCIERGGRMKCFFVLHNLTWPDAKQACRDMGGELATVRSEMETRFLNRTKFILGIHNNNAWIGLRWKDTVRAWLWVDDVAIDWELSYTVFAPGEPDNANGWESCVEFVAADIYENALGYYTGYWNDQECSLRRDALCQKYWNVA